MANELVTKEAAVPTTIMAADMAWGADEVEATDIRIPRILLMQSQSEMVAERKAQAGDIIESTFGNKLGDDKNPIKLVPIYIFKDWKIEKMINGKYEYFGREDFTVSNSNKPREEVINGEQFRNVLGINVLGMLAHEMEDPSALPVMVTFRMTSMNAGKDISTLAVRAKGVGKPAAYYTITLGCDFTKNDKGNFFTFKVKGQEITKNFEENSGRLFQWYQTFKQGTAKVDAEEVVADNEPITVGGTSNAGSKF